MRQELLYIGKKIVENQVQIAGKLIDFQNVHYKHILEHSDESYEQLIEWRAELIQALGKSLFGDSEEVRKEIHQWAEKTGDFSIRNQIPLSDTLRALTCYRSVIWEVFTEELEKRAFQAITMLHVGKIIDPLLDEISNIFGLMWEQHTNKLMDNAYSALDEISVPLVPVDEGVAIIPVVGNIDERRAQLILENSLEKSQNFEVDHLIMDISGVPTINEAVADKLINITKALSLTGIQAHLTGIRPEIAQTLASLNIPFHDLKTSGSLRQALHKIRNRQGL
ncbi:STAS domain-containing protein [Heyndrickxia acidicola]|uniref:STAS domain-containing protein n=1 Tax=Heyndrickxia acidicola TaxID=209389 RepID=A0ABU6MAK7_9BACI|nr:STAS domain-containing protein [Heyndrickxia acidicola]MED1201694.1 STAS domain-containing protein [Heyndrickxia acidicola]